jgi:hypothetical protein
MLERAILRMTAPILPSITPQCSYMSGSVRREENTIYMLHAAAETICRSRHLWLVMPKVLPYPLRGTSLRPISGRREYSTCMLLEVLPDWALVL